MLESEKPMGSHTPPSTRLHIFIFSAGLIAISGCDRQEPSNETTNLVNVDTATETVFVPSVVTESDVPK